MREGLGQTSSALRLLRLPARRGSGHEAASDWIAWIDGDGTYAGADLQRLIARRADADQLIGARACDQGSLKHTRLAVKRLTCRIASGLRKTSIPDLNFTLRIFRCADLLCAPGSKSEFHPLRDTLRLWRVVFHQWSLKSEQTGDVPLTGEHRKGPGKQKDCAPVIFACNCPVPMKALPLLLAASLVANAALVTTVAWRPSAGTTGAADAARADGIRRARHASDGTAAVPIETKDIVAALNGDDPEALRDILREAGLSDEMVRTLVSTRIWKRHEARLKALQPQADPNQPWWKNSKNNNWFGNMTKAQREEMRRLHEEIRDENNRILGPDPKNPNAFGWTDPRLAFLSEDKRKHLQEIQQDYQDLMNEVQQDMQGFRLPSDAEKLRFLREEQMRDIAATLSPEEYRAYELRMSPTADQLRWRMTQFDASEEEYLKIFPLQKAFDEQYARDSYGGSSDRDQAYWKQQQEAEKQLKDQIKASLGEQRYAEYVRSQDHDYQQLQGAARRLNLPEGTAAQVYNLRDTVSAATARIAEDTTLDAAQKKDAYNALAAGTRDQVRAALGTEAADAYLKNNGMRWLKEVEKGNVITFTEGQGFNLKPGIPKEPKKPAAK